MDKHKKGMKEELTIEEQNQWHAFVATVPVTLIEAIHFVVSYQIKNADVYITKSFDGAEVVGERLRKTDIFQHVYVVENALISYPITLKKCFETVKNGWGVVKFIKNKKYDYGYYNNSGWLINSIFYTGFIKGNPECKQRFIEHGYNTYLNDYADKPWYMRLLITLTGFKCMDGSMLEALYLFEPKLLKARQDGEKRKMPLMDIKNKRFIDALNQTYGYQKEKDEFADKKIIIMEQGVLKVDFDKEKFWNRVFEIIDTEHAIIKAHPRQKNSTLANRGIEVCKNHTMPWEITAFNCNIEDKVQITIFSGSCLSKYFCGLEPTVILLYKLLPIDYTYLGKEVVALGNEIGEMYEDSSKYFVPESFEELEAYCKKIGIAKK